jgi:hypothetical protein
MEDLERVAPERNLLQHHRLRLFSENDRHDNFNRKKLFRLRSEIVGRLRLASAYVVAAVCGNINAQTTSTGGSNVRSSHKVVSCDRDSQCPSGQRCGL